MKDPKAINTRRFLPSIASVPGRVIRCQLHPATDLWMSGDRFGRVIASNEKRAKVKLDKSGRVVTLDKRNIVEVFEVQAA